MPKARDETPSDRELVARAVAGEEEACRLLVERYQGVLYRFLLRLVREPALAEDLAQETFVKAFRALGGYDPGRKLASWLFKIAHNSVIDHLRRRGPVTVPLEPGERRPGEPGHLDPLARIEDHGTASPEEVVRGRDLARDLTAAVEELEPHYRELVLLRYEEGLAYQEIAEITGLPLGTVKVRLHRGRKLLAERLAARGWEP